MNNTLDYLPDVSFIDDITLEDLLSDMIKDYESEYKRITGEDKKLAKADPTRFELYACSLQVYQALQYLDRSGKMNLTKYSYGGFLRHLAAFKKVDYQDASKAKTTVRVALSTERTNAVIIPAGTRVAAGGIHFQTDAIAEIPSGTLSKDITVSCTDPGEVGNGLLPGEVNTLVDPVAFVASVTNLTTSAGGAEAESDDNLAYKAHLAPSGYSIGGTEDAYKYWVRAYNATIKDVRVHTSAAGTIDIRILMDNCTLPDEEILQGLESFLKNKGIRPMGDLVVASAPDPVDYDLAVSYCVSRADQNDVIEIQKRVEDAVEDYISWQGSNIGYDIDPGELIGKMQAAGAKKIIVTSPAYQLLAETEVAAIKTKAITYGGLKDD